MSLVHWNPLRELSPFALPFERIFGPELGTPREAPLEWNWTPPVDVYETDERGLVVSAELPGVDPTEVTVTLEDGVLTIAGERKIDTEVDRTRFYRAERAYGSFSRSVMVPRTVDIAAATAEHKAGTLRVRLPLKEEAKTHRIEIKAA